MREAGRRVPGAEGAVELLQLGELHRHRGDRWLRQRRPDGVDGARRPAPGWLVLQRERDGLVTTDRRVRDRAASAGGRGVATAGTGGGRRRLLRAPRRLGGRRLLDGSVVPRAATPTASPKVIVYQLPPPRVALHGAGLGARHGRPERAASRPSRPQRLSNGNLRVSILDSRRTVDGARRPRAGAAR